MAERPVDDLGLDLDCSKCGQSFRLLLAKLQNGALLNCPHCGQQFKIEDYGIAEVGKKPDDAR